jgi:signal transduction histidine kinase
LYADFLDSCTFCIEDNGAGFDASEAKSLFLPFHRLSRATEEGYGMGLAISQRIIALHHGWIRAEGELGKGARFYFSLPCET